MQWVCDICGYVHEEDEPPGICPVCGAPQSKFSEADQDWDEDAPKEAETVEDIDEEDVEIDDTSDADDDDDDDDYYFEEDELNDFSDEDEDR